jgi:MFS family permease
LKDGLSIARAGHTSNGGRPKCLNVIVIPLVPFFILRFGRRQYYAACVIGFTLASFFCGTAGSLTQLVFYRVVQGAFGGGLIATSQIILRDTFPLDKVGTSSALFAIALTLRTGLGPDAGRHPDRSVLLALGLRHQSSPWNLCRNHHPHDAAQCGRAQASPA